MSEEEQTHSVWIRGLVDETGIGSDANVVDALWGVAHALTDIAKALDKIDDAVRKRSYQMKHSDPH